MDDGSGDEITDYGSNYEASRIRPSDTFVFQIFYACPSESRQLVTQHHSSDPRYDKVEIHKLKGR